MCGIVMIKRLDGKPASKTLIKRYKAQSDRGSDGFGYIAVDNELKYEREQIEKAILAKLKTETASEIIFHHRFPTSTPNIAESAHPIMVKNKKLDGIYYVVHNGVISNDDELKKVHEALGFKYTTELKKYVETPDGTSYSLGTQFNDSEALAIEVALLIEGKKSSIEAEGATAFIALQVLNGNPTALYYGRNDGNPLKSHRDKTFWSLASEGQGEMLKPDTLYRYDYETASVSEMPCKIGKYKTSSYTYSGYSGYIGGGYSGAYDTYKPSRHYIDCTCTSCKKAFTDTEKMTDDTLESEIVYIKGQIKTARAMDDYDSEAELKEELKELERERDSLELGFIR